MIIVVLSAYYTSHEKINEDGCQRQVKSRWPGEDAPPNQRRLGNSRKPENEVAAVSDCSVEHSNRMNVS
ncbi:hypothetical protein TGS27_0807 [Geobacillus stearothermophilus]|uniref:Uncharacterized protein n=1 Tax=Geobacillus stearothermophilus TaxID=1422 RepID=A0A150NDJ4_GEOSE|nr:hypothetical protein GS8_1244 [Geobacillus stearothermophilus]KYD20067.1 hypothetical protein B4109_1538 [Geobacillus stearothermophilus]KYD34760.1 hypothetical protein B4114_1532 [Geobacillus stearothermophilus]OAO84835.1 hypothetical protein TGS27_0807 [Geobacillus stearothermophilus]